MILKRIYTHGSGEEWSGTGETGVGLVGMAD